MIFTVTYRNASGQRDFLKLDVPKKSDVWPELERRGITAISVAEGFAAPKSRHWPWRGILLGCAVASLLASVGYFLMRDRAVDNNPGVPAKRPDLTNARASRPPAAPVNPSIRDEPEIPKASGKHIEKREAVPEPPPLDELQSRMTNAPARMPRPIFTNGVEQLIALATPSEPGGRVPPLPMIIDADISEEMRKALAHVIKVHETDSEATLEKKITVARAKEDFQALHESEGCTFSEYVNALRNQANMDADYLAEAHRLNNELYHDETISDGDYIKYRDQINKKLVERGLPAIE